MTADGDAAAPASALPGLLAGGGFDRRTALRAAAASVLGLCLPGALAGCGKRTVRAKRVDYVIACATDTPPQGDLARLIAARARRLHVSPFLAAPPSDPQLTDLRRFVAPATTVDPETGKHPPAYSVIVVGLSDAGAAPIAADAMKRGVKVVGYLADLQPRTAAISVDATRLGTLLAQHAAGWGHERLGGRASVLLVRPAQAFHDPFAPAARQTERALRATLARSAPGMRIVATVQPLRGTELSHALKAHPESRVVLCLSDYPAIIAADALRNMHAAGRERLYVGGLGRPALSSRDTLSELRRDDVLRAVVAARPADLADALVELPRALLRGERAHDIEVGVQLLTPGSAALAAHARDYSRDPAANLQRLDPTSSGRGINLNPLEP